MQHQPLLVRNDTTAPMPSAIRRAMRDLRELQSSTTADLPHAAAAPLDNNLLEWHANIRAPDGPLQGTVFHLIIRLPMDYPASPPDVVMCTVLSHPNVFRGGWICLDLLKAHSSTTPYEGWSSAYSILGILNQLTSFLFADVIPQEYGGFKSSRAGNDASYYRQQAEEYQCSCGHCGTAPWPALPELPVSPPPIASQDIAPAVMMRHGPGIKADPNGRTISCFTDRWGYSMLNHGVSRGFVVFEARLHSHASNAGIARIGWGLDGTRALGTCSNSFGFGGTGKMVYNDHYDTFGRSFGTGDTISTALDLQHGWCYFAINGEPQRPRWRVPEHFVGQTLYPMIGLKNQAVTLNFGPPKFRLQGLENSIVPINRSVRDSIRGHADVSDDVVAAAPNEARNQRCKHAERDAFSRLSRYTILHVLEFMSAVDLHRLKGVDKRFASEIFGRALLERFDLQCFHTRLTVDESILGIGINVIRRGTDGLNQVSSSFDLVSYDAITEGCRLGVWGDQFTDWLPLAINEEHAERAWDKIMSCVAALSRTQSFSAGAVLEVIPSLLNTIVVDFMQASPDEQLSSRFSEKTLLGFCSLHHLLLCIARRVPEVVELATSRLAAFIRNPQARTKVECPNLGQLLMLLTISNGPTWDDLQMPFIIEVMARNVRWSLRDFPHLSRDVAPAVRLRDTFAATATSRRLIMFQVYFLRSIGRPNGASPADTLARYDRRYGRPNNSATHDLSRACSTITSVATWDEYFRFLRTPVPTPDQLNRTLENAVHESLRKGYHYENRQRGRARGGGRRNGRW